MSEDGEFTKLLREKATFALDVEKWEVDVALVLQKVDEAAKDFPATFKKNPHFEGQYLLQLDSDDVGKEITRLAEWFLKWFGVKREETPPT